MVTLKAEATGKVFTWHLKDSLFEAPTTLWLKVPLDNLLKAKLNTGWTFHAGHPIQPLTTLFAFAKLCHSIFQRQIALYMNIFILSKPNMSNILVPRWLHYRDWADICISMYSMHLTQISANICIKLHCSADICSTPTPLGSKRSLMEPRGTP